MRDKEAMPTQRIVELANRHGRYGYRRTTVLLKRESWQVNYKKLEDIWRREV